MTMGINATFSRGLLTAIMKEVRKHFNKETIKKSWGYKYTGQQDAEFHIPPCDHFPNGHYWWGRADNMFHARYQGWMDALHYIKGYEQSAATQVEEFKNQLIEMRKYFKEFNHAELEEGTLDEEIEDINYVLSSLPEILEIARNKLQTDVNTQRKKTRKHGEEAKQEAIQNQAEAKKKREQTKEPEISTTQNIFELFEDDGWEEAHNNIMEAILEQDMGAVADAADTHSNYGAYDTASREAILEHWNKLYPDNPFEYGQWY